MIDIHGNHRTGQGGTLCWHCTLLPHSQGSDYDILCMVKTSWPYCETDIAEEEQTNKFECDVQDCDNRIKKMITPLDNGIVCSICNN